MKLLHLVGLISLLLILNVSIVLCKVFVVSLVKIITFKAILFISVDAEGNWLNDYSHY